MEKKITALVHLFITILLWSFATMMGMPAITDVMMEAVCPGQDECSLAIYLTGFQQAIVGLGTFVMMPLIGNLSDQYGRKTMLTLPMTLSIIPLAILAYSRTTNFFYAYYVLKTLTAMICEGSVNCLALAYVADHISERQRASAIGILTGVSSASLVCGTLAARFLSHTSIFQVATFVATIATIYMRVFLEEYVPQNNSLMEPMIRDDILDDVNQNESNISIKETAVCKKIPSIVDRIFFLKSSVTLSQAAVVAFFNSLADGGMQASFLYFLKARFQFNKDQFADLMLIVGVGEATSQLLLMPLIAPFIDERKLLSLGLLVSCLNTSICSISWADWVPYATIAFNVFGVFASPSLRTVVSKQVGSNDQGKAQGCISGISSFANVLSPLIFSPLSALFLSEEAPFNFPGFSLMVIGLVSMLAFIQSLAMCNVPPTSKSQNTGCLEP